MKWFGLSKDDIPQRVLRVLLALTVVVFMAFFLIGYSHPYTENPDFIEPKLTSVLLIFMLLVVMGAVAAAIWAIVSSMRRRNGTSQSANGVPATAIAVSVVLLTTLTLVASFLAGSNAAMQVNGVEYKEDAWLRTADMFVFSSIGLMVVATAVVAVATIRAHFKNRSK